MEPGQEHQKQLLLVAYPEVKEWLQGDVPPAVAVERLRLRGVEPRLAEEFVSMVRNRATTRRVRAGARDFREARWKNAVAMNRSLAVACLVFFALTESSRSFWQFDRTVPTLLGAGALFFAFRWLSSWIQLVRVRNGR
jgi:hypothetical protein